MKFLYVARYTSENQVTDGLNKADKEGYTTVAVSANNVCVWVLYRNKNMHMGVRDASANDHLEYACARLTNEEMINTFLEDKVAAGFEVFTFSSNDTYVWCTVRRPTTEGSADASSDA